MMRRKPSALTALAARGVLRVATRADVTAATYAAGRGAVQAFFGIRIRSCRGRVRTSCGYVRIDRGIRRRRTGDIGYIDAGSQRCRKENAKELLHRFHSSFPRPKPGSDVKVP